MSDFVEESLREPELDRDRLLSSRDAVGMYFTTSRRTCWHRFRELRMRARRSLVVLLCGGFFFPILRRAFVVVRISLRWRCLWCAALI
jgi:hypothetical protein